MTSTAALLHDIGKLVMSRCLNASVETIVSHARQAGITFVEAEQHLFGVDHAAVGAAIAVEWHFPAEVADAIARHHDRQLGRSTPVLDAVVIANMVAKNIGVGLGAEGFNLTVDSECVRRLGLDFTKFARICLQTDTWLRELRDAQKDSRPRLERAAFSGTRRKPIAEDAEERRTAEATGRPPALGRLMD